MTDDSPYFLTLPEVLKSDQAERIVPHHRQSGGPAMTNPALERFCDELDALLEHWMKKPGDDQLSFAEVIGVMTARIHMLVSSVPSDDEGDE